ncbi:hypothetical protein BT69DRAFT_1285146, partial [Atractiella rhizophila]
AASAISLLKPLYQSCPDISFSILSSLLNIVLRGTDDACLEFMEANLGESECADVWKGLNDVLEITMHAGKEAKTYYDKVAKYLYPVLSDMVEPVQRGMDMLPWIKRKALSIIWHSVSGHAENKRKLTNNQLLGAKRLGSIIFAGQDLTTTQLARELAFRLKDVLPTARTETFCTPLFAEFGKGPAETLKRHFNNTHSRDFYDVRQ